MGLEHIAGVPGKRSFSHCSRGERLLKRELQGLCSVATSLSWERSRRMDADERDATRHTRLMGLLQTIPHWLVGHTFAPSWLTGRWAHPAVGYLAAVLLQVITVTGLTELVRLFPSFQFQEAVVILVILVVALNWGTGPSLLATLFAG